VRCSYPESTRRRPKGDAHSNSRTEPDRHTPNFAEALSSSLASEAKSDYWTPSTGVFDISAHDFASLPDDLFSTYPDIDLGPMNGQLDTPSVLVTTNSGDTQVTAWTSNSPYTPIPRAPTALIRSFQRHTPQPRSTHFSHLIIQTLRSYPVALLHSSTLPPYIHPTFTHSTAGPDLEPLTTCLSLLHMLRASPPSTSRRLFWRNVQFECERFVAECRTMSRVTVLAAIQALSLYCLLRIREGETEENNVDTLLLNSVVVSSILGNPAGHEIAANSC
jgi:hypothetical protein